MGTGPYASLNNPDIFNEAKNSSSPYWTNSGGGTVEDKVYSSVPVDAPNSNARDVVDTENSYGLANFAANNKSSHLKIHHSPS